MRLPLTAGQLSLWAGEKLHPGVPLNNTCYTFDIRGRLNPSLFKIAFRKLVDSVDAFRLLFFEENGEPYQTPMESVNYEIEIIDFSTESDESKIAVWLLDRSRLKLDISERVFDSVLLKLRENRYIWCLVMHHLVTDVVSFRLIFDRLAELYDSLDKNVPLKSQDSHSYTDYIHFELSQKNESNVNSHWTEKVKQYEEIPSLYGNKSQRGVTASTRISIPLGPERTKKLKELANLPEVRSWTIHLTLFTILASLLHIYLYRISGQKKLAIGAPSHNRTSRKFQDVIGYFIEIFPVTAEISGEDTFFKVLQRMGLEVNNYIRHSQLGQVTPEISRSFNVVLNYIPTGFSDFNGMETSSKWIHPGHMDGSHQLRCHAVDFDATGEMELLFDLNHGTFDQKLRERAPQHFLRLMDAMLTDINLKVDKPSLVSKDEVCEVLASEIATNEWEPVLDNFDHIVSTYGSSVALRSGDDTLSYRQLNKKANQLAQYLKQSGVMQGDKLALYFFRSTDYIISLLAAMKLGAVFVPIASDWPVERIKYVLKNSDCRIVLSQSDLKKNAEALNIEVLDVSSKNKGIFESLNYDLGVKNDRNDIAYTLYTSGSTGNPKGVLIPYGGLSNYLSWAKTYYAGEKAFNFPFFTSIGFDLTITSIFLPLITGGELIIYREGKGGPDISLMQVIEDSRINAIKLTPSHINLIQGRDLSASNIRTVIVGGEDFKTGAANTIRDSFGGSPRIYNEYGPTEATIGCVVCEYDETHHTATSVPIGKPILNMQAYVLDTKKNMAPHQLAGELYLSGKGLSEGYANMEELTKEKFVDNPFLPGTKMYRTGDLARWNGEGDLEYLGRMDEQVKLNGYRIELPDIEANLISHPAIDHAAVVVLDEKHAMPEKEIRNCAECGLPSNFPNADFNAEGVCHLCKAFKGYKEKTDKYFKTEENLWELLTSKKNSNTTYDCLSLLSGGKDSTYILAKLVNMGLKVLAFTLDNGYISDQAKTNIDKIVSKLGVDHMYGETPYMNKIFVDSLHRHYNVCNGCFKTIYTLSTKVALDKKIPFVVTGLSRGQFFETRLTEELFWDETDDTGTIDDTILEARKLYHREEDAVKKLLDVSIFKDEDTFKKVQFVDFYRYSDVSLGEMLRFLKEQVAWVRPTDTGRSTNCLINQVGIYVHKKEKGYSNYSFPYSWDVRLGHKTREETLEEINEYIDEKEVKRIMKEIGYDGENVTGENRKRLVGYYTGKSKLSSSELDKFLSNKLPRYMVPSLFKYLDNLPLNGNGKVDKSLLRSLNEIQVEMDTPFVAPRNEIEELLEDIWKEVMHLNKIGVHDNFITLGGHSLAAIRITTRINEELEMNFPLNKIFELPTIGEYAGYIEETLKELMQ